MTLYVYHLLPERRKKISLEEMLDVLEDVGKTLLKMHEDGLVHRDVKAKNVLYRKTSRMANASQTHRLWPHLCA